jgi:phage protein D
MEFGEFERNYKNFYAPRFELTVAKEDVARKGMEIVSVTVDNTLDAADQASFTVSNAFDVKKRDVRWFDQEIAVGKEVQVRMGYSDRLATMFIGLITAVKINFPSGGMPQLEVTAFDLSHPMTKNKKSKSWDKTNSTVKDSDIASEISSLYKLTSQVDDSRVPHVTIKQDNQSDFEFLKKRAEENGFEFFVFEHTLFFRKPAYQENPVVNLEWGKTLMSFAPEVNIADQVEEVEVRGWDPKTKKEIVGKARVGDEEGRDQGRKSGSELARGVTREKTVERVRRPVYAQDEADRLAKAILTRLAEGLVTGSGECLGLPELRAGKSVLLQGVGKKFNKPYYVEKTNHNISASGYRTTFNIKETTI